MEEPKSISQSWSHQRWDNKLRKCVYTPTFHVQWPYEDKMKRVGIDVGLELIRNGFLPVNIHMSEWLLDNGHEDLAKHTREEIEQHKASSKAKVNGSYQGH